MNGITAFKQLRWRSEDESGSVRWWTVDGVQFQSCMFEEKMCRREKKPSDGLSEEEWRGMLERSAVF